MVWKIWLIDFQASKALSWSLLTLPTFWMWLVMYLLVIEKTLCLSIMDFVWIIPLSTKKKNLVSVTIESGDNVVVLGLVVLWSGDHIMKWILCFCQFCSFLGKSDGSTVFQGALGLSARVSEANEMGHFTGQYSRKFSWNFNIMFYFIGKYSCLYLAIKFHSKCSGVLNTKVRQRLFAELSASLKELLKCQFL